MIAGCRLFGDPETKVVGVSPDDSASEIAARVASITNGVFELLNQPHKIFEEEVIVLDSYVGDGYAVETPKGKTACELLAKTEGVILDPVYTAKAFAALLDWIEKGRLTESDTVLFWHTGGQLAYFYAPVE
jgi:D-cysteine desulfhydrase